MRILIDTKFHGGYLLPKSEAEQVEKILGRKWRFGEDVQGAETFHEIMAVIGPQIDKAGGKALDAIECALRLTDEFMTRTADMRSDAVQGEAIHKATPGESPEPKAHFVPEEAPVDVQMLLNQIGSVIARDHYGNLRGRIAAVFVLEERPAEATDLKATDQVHPAPQAADPQSVAYPKLDPDPALAKRILKNQLLAAYIAHIRAHVRVEEAMAREIEKRTGR